MSILVPLLWLTAMAAALCHGAVKPRELIRLAWGVSAFAVVMAGAMWLKLSEGWAAGLIGVSAVWQLLRPVGARWSLAMAGAAAKLGKDFLAAC